MRKTQGKWDGSYRYPTAHYFSKTASRFRSFNKSRSFDKRTTIVNNPATTHYQKTLLHCLPMIVLLDQRFHEEEDCIPCQRILDYQHQQSKISAIYSFAAVQRFPFIATEHILFRRFRHKDFSQ